VPWVTDTVAAAEHAASSGAHACPRRFTNEQVDRILIEKLPIRYDHDITIHYSNCTYHVGIWPVGGAPDSQTLIELDENGNLPAIVVKYGTKSKLARLGVSYRNVTRPSYPARALEEKLAGTILVRVSINTDTTVSDATIMQVTPDSVVELADSLVETIRQWRFNPLMLYGNAVPSEVIVPVEFRIEGQESPSISEQKFMVPDDVPVMERIVIGGEPIP
jgi:TonB family protein